MVVKYTLNILPNSTNISNARTLRYNNGTCCNLYSLYNGSYNSMLSIPKETSNIVRTNIICMFAKLLIHNIVNSINVNFLQFLWATIWNDVYHHAKAQKSTFGVLGNNWQKIK